MREKRANIFRFFRSETAYLSKIRLPAGFSMFDENAFYGSGVETVWIDPTNTQLDEIPKGTFEDCENLHTVYLPAGVTDIGLYGLNQFISIWESDHLPEPSTIKHIYFAGTEEQWNSLDVHFTWSNAAATVPVTYSAAEFFGEISDTVVTLNWKG